MQCMHACTLTCACTYMHMHVCRHGPLACSVVLCAVALASRAMISAWRFASSTRVLASVRATSCWYLAFSIACRATSVPSMADEKRVGNSTLSSWKACTMAEWLASAWLSTSRILAPTTVRL